MQPPRASVKAEGGICRVTPLLFQLVMPGPAGFAGYLICLRALRRDPGIHVFL